MRRPARRLLLAGAVALLAMLVLLQLRHERAQQPGPLLALDPAAITRITVQVSGGPLRRFVRRDGAWWMLAPQQGRADAAHLASLAAIAAAPVARWLPAGGFDPRKLGLDPPAATLTLDGTRLAFGTLDALQPLRYIEVDGRIALVPDRFAPFLSMAPQLELAAPAPAASH